MDFVDGTSDDDTFVLNFDDAAFERILAEQPEEDNRVFTLSQVLVSLPKKKEYWLQGPVG